MAPFLSRLLNNRRRKSILGQELLTTTNNWKQPTFDSHDQVRMLLYRECDGQDRKLLFDSKSVKRIAPLTEKKGCTKSGQHCRKKCSFQNSSHSQDIGFKKNETIEKEIKHELLKPYSDEQILREMIFGAVATSYSGTTMKVHNIRSPPQLMISIVFPVPLLDNVRFTERELEESGSWYSASNEITISKRVDKTEALLAHSVPVDVPSRMTAHNRNLYYTSDSFQSSASNSSLASLHLSLEKSSSLPHSGSFSSLQRRLLRNRATSMDFGLHKKTEYSSEEPRNGSRRKVKLGLSIVISLNKSEQENKLFQEFFFSHVTLIESHVKRLKEAVTQAAMDKRNFVDIMFEGLEKFQVALQDLYTAPRLTSPIWLTMISSPANYHHICATFINEFASLLQTYDTKETNFFCSTLLTAVLTHHLAWVPTVTPADAIVSQTCNEKHMPQWVDVLARSHPYNPLWMQLGDLYGALGIPSKIAKTVITGKKTEIVIRFLSVLSYFIRCSDIYERNQERHFDDFNGTSPASQEKRLDESLLDSYGKKFSNHSIFADEQNMDHRCSSKNSSNALHCVNKKCLSNRHNTFQAFTFPQWSCTHSLNESKVKLLQKANGISDLKWKSYDNKMEDKFKPFGSVDEIYHPFPFMNNNCFSEEWNLTSSSLHKNNVNKNCSVEKPTCVGGSFNISHPDSLGYESMEEHREEDQLKGIERVSAYSNGILLTVTQCAKNDLCKHKYKSTKDNIEHTNLGKNGISVPFISIHPETCSLHEQMGASEKSSVDFLSKHYVNNFRYSYLRHSSKHSLSPSPPSFCECLKNITCSDPSTELLEEGYHSMDEPKVLRRKPSKKGLTLAESLKIHDECIPEKTTELPLPSIHNVAIKTDHIAFQNFGISLVAGISDHYMADFCIQGVQGLVNEEKIRDDLVASVQVPVLGEPVGEAVCIVADTDNWSVQLISSNWMEGDRTGCCGIRVGMSSFVADLCESLLQMHQLGISPEMCIIHLEDRLQELYFRSRTLAEYLCSQQSPTLPAQAASALNVDASDIPLLLSVATTHSPCITIIN